MEHMLNDKETRKFQAQLGGLGCSFCASTLENAFAKKEGVTEAAVSLAHNEILVKYLPEQITTNDIRNTITGLGYSIRDANKLKAYEEDKQEVRQKRSKLLIAACFSTAGLLIIMLAMWYTQPWLIGVEGVLALATVFGPGLFILDMAFQSIRRGIMNQHVLLEFGAFAGLIGGSIGLFIKGFPTIQFFGVSVFITAYHILSDFTSLKVRTKASQAVRNLLKLQPPMAKVIRNEGEYEIPVEDLRVNDLVRIRPGENIPADGEVVDGNSSVDESIITGESMPVEKKVGSEVIGGSINISGTLIEKVIHLGEESFLKKVANNIEEARAFKPGIIALVDKILRYYVPGILSFAGLGVLIWTLRDYIATGNVDIARGIFAALAVLVMGYPCALGMATPLAMIHGGGMAARKGILVRSSIAFQALKDARVIVFDKTGTVTTGKPEVNDIITLDGTNENDVIVNAASAEYPSEHPLAKAIVNYALGKKSSIQHVEEFQNYPGEGVEAKLNDNKIFVGSLNFLKDRDVLVSEEAKVISQKIKSNAKTVIGAAENIKLVGLISISDTIKSDAKEAVSKIKKLGLKPVMFTGDNKQTAAAIAKEVGIDDFKAELLPEQKLRELMKLQDHGRKVIMVGDGINDAPALMQSDVGVAIGTGTDIAIESADIVVMGSGLNSIPEIYQIGKNSYKKTVQNLTLAFLFNGIGVPLALTGLVPPVWAMAAMVASVSTVLVNSFGISGFMAKKIEKKNFQFKIENMHCENCVNGIKTALHEKLGIIDVSADLTKNMIEVSYGNTNVSAEGIEKILVEKGYKPESIDSKTT